MLLEDVDMWCKIGQCVRAYLRGGRVAYAPSAKHGNHSRIADVVLCCRDHGVDIEKYFLCGCDKCHCESSKAQCHF